MNNNTSQTTSVDVILDQYAFDEQSSSTELIDFTLKSLQSLLPLAGFKIVKSRKALDMKTKELLISIYLQANRHNTAGTSIEVMLHCKVTHIKHKSYTVLPESYYEHSEIKWYELFGKDAQFEQARQRYVASLSEVQKQQYDEVVIKFQENVNSPIKRGEDWAYLTVAKKEVHEI